MPPGDGAEKQLARTHAQRSPERAGGSGNEHEREDGDGPSAPKRQGALAAAFAEAASAPPAQNAAAGATAPPTSALKRAAGTYGTYASLLRA